MHFYFLFLNIVENGAFFFFKYARVYESKLSKFKRVKILKLGQFNF